MSKERYFKEPKYFVVTNHKDSIMFLGVVIKAIGTLGGWYIMKDGGDGGWEMIKKNQVSKITKEEYDILKKRNKLIFDFYKNN